VATLCYSSLSFLFPLRVPSITAGQDLLVYRTLLIKDVAELLSFPARLQPAPQRGRCYDAANDLFTQTCPGWMDWMTDDKRHLGCQGGDNSFPS
jgi:hypothetical protein